VIGCDDLVQLCSLLLDVKDSGLIDGPDFINIDLLNFFLLFLTELIEKLPLALKLVDDVPIFFYLELVLFYILLNSKYDF
jgi:hypothetical protein